MNTPAKVNSKGKLNKFNVFIASSTCTVQIGAERSEIINTVTQTGDVWFFFSGGNSTMAHPMTDVRIGSKGVHTVLTFNVEEYGRQEVTEKLLNCRKQKLLWR